MIQINNTLSTKNGLITAKNYTEVAAVWFPNINTLSAISEKLRDKITIMFLS